MKTLSEAIELMHDREVEKEKALGNDRILDALQRLMFKDEIDDWHNHGIKPSALSLTVVCKNCNYMLAYHDFRLCPNHLGSWVMSDRIRRISEMENQEPAAASLEIAPRYVSVEMRTPQGTSNWDSVDEMTISVEQEQRLQYEYQAFVSKVISIIFVEQSSDDRNTTGKHGM